MDFNSAYVAYVKTDLMGHITEVNSSAFLTDATGWIEIGSGYGDKYHHAQGNFFPKPIQTDGGAYRYKLVDGVAVECSDEEIAEQETENRPETEPTRSTEERLTDLEETTSQQGEILNILLSGETGDAV